MGPVGREKNEVRVHDVEVGVHDVDDVDLGSGGYKAKEKGSRGSLAASHDVLLKLLHAA